MAYVYIPSCKFTEFSPKASELLVRYMRGRYEAAVMGCCRSGHRNLERSDIAVTVCNTCQAIAAEDSPARVMSIFELIASDKEFPLPDMKGETMALQDCWRSCGCLAQHDAVRTILKRMDVDVVELPQNRDQSRFCGTTLLVGQPPENAQLAPKRFGTDAAGMFTPCAPDEQRRRMREHCAKIGPEKVVCYCVPCTKGIRLGGKHGIHLAELVLGFGC